MATSPYTSTLYDPNQANYNAYMQQNFTPNLNINSSGGSGGSLSTVPQKSSISPNTGTTATGGYTSNPTPQTGSGTAYGRVPGATPVPPSTFTQAGGVYPGLKSQAGQVSSNVMGELQGVLSPETIDMINQHAAQFGVGSGMPLSGFAASQGLRSLGLNTEAVQQQGEQGYLSALSGIGNAQLPPALLAQISTQNAELGAAPDPQMAAQQMIKNYQNAMRGYGGSTFNPQGGNLNLNPQTGYTQDANFQDQPALGALPYATTPDYQPMNQVPAMYYNNYDPSQGYDPTSTGTNADETGLQDFYSIPYNP